MNLQFKQVDKTKVNILQIFWKSTLIISLSACSSSANKEENTSINIKGEKMMLNEIYSSQIKPDHFLKIQENYAEVNSIVLKYFKIGENKNDVISKLTKMKVTLNKKSNGTIVVSAIKGNSPFFSKDDDKTVEVAFEFDDSNKLSNIKSRYFRRQ